MSSFFQSSDTMPLPPVEKERRSLIRAPLFALIISSLLFLAFYGRCHRVIADQNGEDAVPLKELIRRDITDFDGQLTKLRITDTGHWASLHEQKCKLTVCGKRGDLRCDAGWAMPPNGSKIKDNCGGAGDRIVCCPVESMPTACVGVIASSEAWLTTGSNGVAAKAADRAMANAMRARVLCSTHDMLQSIVIDQAFNPFVAKRQALKL